MKYFILFLLTFIFYRQIAAQDSSNLVYIDSDGRLKWMENKRDAYFFGVNYSLPFAFSYRALKNKKIPHRDIIDMDVNQFKRLGLNAYRIHVWDREISDKEGNLINNEHLELLDYLISKLIENNIYVILTPIAWWGTGWPEPDVSTEGFSSFYTKLESTTKPEAIKAHINYLKQFVNHVNSFTGKSYKDEASIIGFEIINEPILPRSSDSVRNYVNATAEAIREEGVTKPVFFNISENPGKEQWEGVASSAVDGVSFQWYPTGLVKYSELKGNFIPNVFSYPLPHLLSPLLKRGDVEGRMYKPKAKMVYEFDAADIGKSYMYPLMAHSFKEAGMQWAAMFCYDPSAIAQYNSEYSTHYLNLLYTPQKAIGFLIASYLFNNEENSEKKIDSSSIVMNNALVNYDYDLSLLNTSERFYYSNSNDAAPKKINSLKSVAGWGNSRVIKYDGRGAYFLDKINDDLWKLELYPDAVWNKDPFGRNGLDEPVAKLIWKSHKMKILLPGLKSGFNIYDLHKNKFSASDFNINLEPGIYFLTNKSELSKTDFYPDSIVFTKIKAWGEFIDNFNSTEIKNLTPSFLYENNGNKISAELYSGEDLPGLNIYLKKSGWQSYNKFKMEKIDDFLYEFNIPRELSSNGILYYFISISKDKNVLTFPGKSKKPPDDWSFNSPNPYILSILPAADKKIIYDPAGDLKNLIQPNLWSFAEYRIGYTFDEMNEEQLSIEINKVKKSFPEYAVQFYAGDYLKNSGSPGGSLELEIMKDPGGPDSLGVRIIFNNSTGFGRKIRLKNYYEKIIIPVSAPEIFKYALLPRPYPAFLPYWFDSLPLESGKENLKIESIQLAIPLPEPGKELKGYGIKLKKISFLENKAG